MSTDHTHVQTNEPVQPDALNIRAIVWFMVILFVTTIACQLIVWGLFAFSEWRVARGEAPRAVMAAPVTSPAICPETGEVLTEACDPADPTAVPRPGFPTLLVREPTYLGRFRAEHEEMQQNYGWVDQTMGTVRLPVDRAKDVVLERGLPSRPAPAAGASPAAASGAEAPVPTAQPEPVPTSETSAPQH